MKTPVIVIIMLMLGCMSAMAGESVTLANGEWPPYFSDSFEYGGVGSRVGTEAFALVGVDVEYEYFPWKRGLELARLGEIHGAIGWRITPEREHDFLFSEPIFEVSTVFFHRLGRDFDWQTFDDVGGLTIGATLGYGYIDLLKPFVEAHGGKIELAPSDEINLQKLAAGRIDIFPCAQSVGYYLLRTRFLPGTADTLRHHPKPLLTGEIYLLLSRHLPNGRDLIRRFNQGLRQLKESGQYDRFFIESIKGDYMPEMERRRTSSDEAAAF